MTIEKTIAGLQRLDLSTYTTEEAIALLKGMKGVVMVRTNLHAGKTFGFNRSI